MTPEQKRKTFQRLKSLSNEKFWQAMNELHTKAYAAAERHYGEAMDIVLTPKQKTAVVEKAGEIRELWDGMRTLTVDETESEVFAPMNQEVQR